jgi:predicted metal-binding membrane protein
MTPYTLPTRQRAVTGLGLSFITTISWIYVWRLAHDPLAMCMVNMKPWTWPDLIALFAMWTVMMVAMMIPSASPMILAFAEVNRSRPKPSLPYVPTIVFVLGYVAVWCSFSVLATVAQEVLHSATLVSSMGVSISGILGGVLLASAGIFQWTPFKNACLLRCRSPLGFFLTEWREGARGALYMGLRHGTYCVGCCWLLMALLFVVGVMNLWWVAAIAAFVLIEKITAAGPSIARATGVLLILWGGWLLARVFF